MRYYDPYRSTKENFRYYQRYKPYKASINYDGITYDSINTRYDLLSGHLITYSSGALSFFLTKLANEKVKSFTLDKTVFIKVDLSESHNKDSQHFYELAYNTDLGLQLLISRRKTPRARRSPSGDTYYSFPTYKEYYLRKNSTYFRVSKKHDFIRLFPKLKQEVRDYYRSYRSTEKKDPDQFFKNLVSFIDKMYSYQNK